jgi:hypothetical protein
MVGYVAHEHTGEPPTGRPLPNFGTVVGPWA